MKAAAGMFAAFPSLAELDGPAASRLGASCRARLLEAGTLVFEPGQTCQHYLLVQSGSVRVHLLDAEGHEIVLYRLSAGDTCVLTTAALLGETAYSAYAVTEQPTSAAMLPAAAFDDLVVQSRAFRRFVFSSHADRIAALMEIISDVAFKRVQVRLARWLLRHADREGHVDKTHEAIAVELGTAREVVSRNLKSLQRLQRLRLRQSSVQITDFDAIRRLAEGHEK